MNALMPEGPFGREGPNPFGSAWETGGSDDENHEERERWTGGGGDEEGRRPLDRSMVRRPARKPAAHHRPRQHGRGRGLQERDREARRILDQRVQRDTRERHGPL